MTVLVQQHLVGSLEEVDVNGAGGSQVLRLLHGVALQGLDDLTLLVGGAQRLLASGVVLEVLLVNGDVDVGLLAELAQLQRGELDLGRATAPEDVHVSDR